MGVRFHQVPGVVMKLAHGVFKIRGFGVKGAAHYSQGLHLVERGDDLSILGLLDGMLGLEAGEEEHDPELDWVS